MTDIIQLQAVSKTYCNGDIEFSALKSINFNIAEGEFVSVLGKSGSGKSTLLNMLAAIDQPSSGKVCIKQLDFTQKRLEELDTWRGTNIGLIFQFFQLMPTLTAIENVMLPMDFSAKLSLSQRHERALSLLESVQLKDKINMFPSSLSGGEKQRVAIARSLANDPDIILADEPTGNLDSATATIIYDLFVGLNQQGKTVVIVSHDPDVCAYTNRTITLSDGALLSDIKGVSDIKKMSDIKSVSDSKDLPNVKNAKQIKGKNTNEQESVDV